MITDKDCADLCSESYASFSPRSLVTWDFWESGLGNDGVAYGIKVIEDKPVIVFPGSRTFLDWRRDLDTWPSAPIVHDTIGRIHPGFYHGMEVTWEKIRVRLGNTPAILVGHSLGAARANLLSGLATLDEVPVIGKVLFGEPKAGMEALAAVTSRVPGRTYRNGGDRFHDQVTDTPYYVPPLLLYQHDRDFALVSAAPAPHDLWGFFAWHHMPLYASKTPPTIISA